MQWVKTYLFSKFTDLWKLILPFLVFLSIAFSLIIGLLSFNLNVNLNITNIWEQGHFRNIEYSKQEFNLGKTSNLNSWDFRTDDNGITQIQKFLEKGLTKVKTNYNNEFIQEFLIELGKVEGDLNRISNSKFEKIKQDTMKSEYLNLKYYNWNLLDSFIIQQVFQEFPVTSSIFTIREVGIVGSDISNEKYRFILSPTFDNNAPEYLKKNINSELYIYEQLSDDKLNKLNNNYIYLTPSDLKVKNLKVGDSYTFYINNKVCNTTIAGTAVSKTTIPKDKETTNIYIHHIILYLKII